MPALACNLLGLHESDTGCNGLAILAAVAGNLYARMRGGNLSVEGVMGDKDLELSGGDLTIQVSSSMASTNAVFAQLLAFFPSQLLLRNSRKR